VKNQGELCASWAFAVTGVVEGARAVQGHGLASLSEQQLVDCASPGCGGPSGDSCTCAQIGCFFDSVQMNGECSEAAYPYTGQIGSCKAASCMPVVPSGFASNWQRLDGEAGVAGALSSAPVLARLEVGDNGQTLQSFLDYHSGVYAPATWDASVVQWVLLVGYTSQYFIVKNSFGTSWGMSGYLYLARGVNRLGVGNFAYALQSGSATSGACSLPGDTCFEMSAEDCAAASGTFGGVGTFCQTTCVPPTPTFTPTITPTTTPTVTPTSTPTNTPIAQGGACTAGSQCATTFCVDGVCCDTACTEPLQKCNLPGHDGTCSSAAAVAPTLTPHALMIGLILLAVTAAWAIRRRTR